MAEQDTAARVGSSAAAVRLPCDGEGSRAARQARSPCELRAISAHRAPTSSCVSSMRGGARIRVFIAGAGGRRTCLASWPRRRFCPLSRAHPYAGGGRSGLLLSIVQMPKGIPVATVASAARRTRPARGRDPGPLDRRCAGGCSLIATPDSLDRRGRDERRPPRWTLASLDESQRPASRNRSTDERGSIRPRRHPRLARADGSVLLALRRAARLGPVAARSATPRCPSCGFVSYVNPRLWLPRAHHEPRSHSHKKGIEPAEGSGPAGRFLEIDETVREAAVRETLEETGLRVEAGAIVGSTREFKRRWSSSPSRLA